MIEPISKNPDTAPSRRSALRLVILLLGLTLFCCLSGAFSVTEFGERTYHWQGLDVQVRLLPALRGQTRIVLTPLGEVHAATHLTPVALRVSLQGVSLERMKSLALHPPPRLSLEKDFRRAAAADLREFSFWQILLGSLGGLIAPLFLRLRRARFWLYSAAVGGGSVAALLFLTLRTFNAAAFDSPTYTGSLRQAPMIVALGRSVFLRASALSDKLRVVATNLNALYGRLGRATGPTPDEAQNVRILHISDIHNNVAAMDFVQDLAEDFHASAVIDTGDLTDFGLPVEATVSKGLARLPMRYLFVAGNHDSQSTVGAVRSHHNATILDGRRVDIDGLSVLGLPDPSSARPSHGSVDTSDAALQSAAGQLLMDVRQTPTPPDIVCVHNPRQAASVIGRVPLVLCGHLHRAYVETDSGTVVCNAGTTGGAGLRFFDRSEGVPLSAALLTFSRLPRPHLLSIDMIVLDGSLSQYSITRHTYGLLPAGQAGDNAAAGRP